jgi:hypothetical protein
MAPFWPTHRSPCQLFLSGSESYGKSRLHLPNAGGQIDLLGQSHLRSEILRLGIRRRPVASSLAPWRRIEGRRLLVRLGAGNDLGIFVDSIGIRAARILPITLALSIGATAALQRTFQTHRDAGRIRAWTGIAALSIGLDAQSSQEHGRVELHGELRRDWHSLGLQNASEALETDDEAQGLVQDGLGGLGPEKRVHSREKGASAREGGRTEAFMKSFEA